MKKITDVAFCGRDSRRSHSSPASGHDLTVAALLAEPVFSSRPTGSRRPGLGRTRPPQWWRGLLALCLTGLVLLTGGSGLFAADATLMGLTGTMLVPGLDVLPHGGARAAAHLTGTQDSHEGSLKGVFAYSDDTEVAVVKRFVTGKGKDQTDPIFAAKYKLRDNLAVAAIIDTTDGYKDSVMFLSGLPGNRVVIGFGANIAVDGTEQFAHFGRYEDRFSPVDPLFFIFGASLNLDPDTEVTMDYAGNDFVIGLRHHFDERLALDFGYYTPDRLIGESRYCLGANFGF